MTAASTNAARRACPNCNAQSEGAYCSSCGQAFPVEKDYSLRLLLLAAVEELTSYDGRVWGTARALLFKPGQLARDHFDGKRAQHVTPFRIFVYTNLIAWLIIPYLGMTGFNLAYARRAAIFSVFWERALLWRADVAGVTLKAMEARVEAVGGAEDAAAILCMIPLFAFGAWVALAGKRYRFVQHLVFAAHNYCVHLLFAVIMIGSVLTTLVIVAKAHPEWPWMIPVLKNNWFQHSLVFPLLGPYMYAAVKRAYALTPLEAWWRAALMTCWAVVVAKSFFDIAWVLVLLFA